MRYVPTAMMAAVALAGILLTIQLATTDIPIYTGHLFLDHPDPTHPGKMIAQTVTSAELTAKALLVVAAFVYIAALHQSRRSNPTHK